MEGTMAEVRLFAGNFQPRNWAYCQGQLISINSNQALFSLLGTTYGGDGRSTFGLPELRGRTAVGEGTGAGLSHYSLGEQTGSTYVTLTTGQIPAHTHSINANLTGAVQYGCVADEATLEDGSGAYPAVPDDGSTVYNPSTDGVMANAPVSFSGSITCLNSGSNQSHYNMMPFLTSNYIICMYGVYPSRH